MRRLLLLAALLLCTLLGTAQPASAHTELVSSSPKDGATPAKAPTHLTLTFDEAVDVADVRVLTVNGDRLPVSRTARRNVVRVALGSPADGSFALVWSVVDEEDGHASSGRIAFSVAAKAARAGSAESSAPAGSAESSAPADSAEASSPAPSPSVRKGLVAVRWAGYLALALFVGGLAFVALLWPGGAYEPRARALLGFAWTVGLLATVAAVGLQGAYASLGGLRDALDPATYADVLGTRPGIVLAARGLMWVLAAVVLAALLQGAARSPGWRVGALAVTFGLLRTTGMTGHNSEGSEPTWGAVADFLHLLGAALWIGGLAMLTLAVLPRRRPGELAEVVPGYARLAALSVTGIVGAGLVLAWQVVGSYDALLHTSYGHLLLVKTAVLGGVLVAAYASRQWVRTRLDLAVLLRGDAATVRSFGYSVAAETGLVLVVLAVTSLLVTADPGR